MKSPQNTTKKSFTKLYFTLVTAGHVDHGKTSLIESLTNTNPDRLKEEQLRSMTIDLGYAHFSTKVKYKGYDKELIVGFVDVPGHDKFIRNMLAGVGCQNTALLVVAANESVKPQTIQHLKILKLLNYKNIITVISKTDLGDKGQIAKTKAQVSTALEHFDLNSAIVLEYSKFDLNSIANIKETIINLAQKELNDVFTSNLFTSPLAYLPIDRVFSKHGIGTVVTGTLKEGVLDLTDTIYINPGNYIAKIKSLQSFNENVSHGFTGSRLAINLNIKQGREKDLKRGLILANKELTSSECLIVSLINDKNSHEKIKTNCDVTFYHNTSERQGKLYKYKTSENIIAKIKLNEPTVCFPGDMGILRLKNDKILGCKIIANAEILEFKNVSLHKLSDLIIQNKFDEAILLLLESKSYITLNSLKAFIPGPFITISTNKLLDREDIVFISNLIFLKKEINSHNKKILKFIEYSSRQNPVNKKNISDFLEHNLFPKSNLEFNKITDYFVSNLIKDNLLEVYESNYYLKTDKQDVELTNLFKSILETINNQPCIEIKELAKIHNIEVMKLRLILKNLAAKKLLFIINYEFVSSHESILKAQKVLQDLWREKQQISPSDFKISLNITRKYALAMLSFFDDNFITRLEKNTRILNPNKFFK